MSSNPCKKSLFMRLGIVSDPHSYLVGLEPALNWLGKEATDITGPYIAR
jgi:hypothetical protein